MQTGGLKLGIFIWGRLTIHNPIRIWLLCAVADGVQCHSLLTRYKPGRDPFDDILFSMGLIQATMLAAYLISLVVYLLGTPGGDYERLANDHHGRWEN